MNNRLMLSLVVGISLLAFSAEAAGLFLAPRGVRPLGRAGAFVAGADDPNSLSYNPAGLAFSHSGMLIDFGIPLHFTDYTRQNPLSGEFMPTVQGQGLTLPSPTIATAYRFEALPEVTFGTSVHADYPLLQNWPDKLPDGTPAPQRYAILNYKGTAVVKLSGGAAWEPIKGLAIGAAFQMFAGLFSSEVTLSNCDGAIFCSFPESPDYDARIQFASKPFISPGFHLGVIYSPISLVRFGLAFESGYKVAADSTLRTRLPSAAAFSQATSEPDEPEGVVRFDLPLAVRAGIEFRDEDHWRVEIAWVWENWSVHDVLELDIEEAVIRNVVGIGDYRLTKVEIPRYLTDTWSLRVGAEGKLPSQHPITLRGGFAYEPSAIEDEFLTAMSVDTDKVIMAFGAGTELWGIAFDFTYSFIFMPTRTVLKSDVLQTTAARPAWEGRTTIGEGIYESQAHVLGLGASWAL
ncbi:MAG: hypothetical protein HOI23_09920 [Deltaproteobacteria bacterium]|nr:hypothetical protein [Deltaproteobacteria bacterium]MBT6491588.1 hypothetical protein [Deltaproteobacteria bacterium]